jgi:hypothetical protein
MAQKSEAQVFFKKLLSFAYQSAELLLAVLELRSSLLVDKERRCRAFLRPAFYLIQI